LVIDWDFEHRTDCAQQCLFADRFAQEVSRTRAQRPAFLFLACSALKKIMGIKWWFSPKRRCNSKPSIPGMRTSSSRQLFLPHTRIAGSLQPMKKPRPAGHSNARASG